MDLVETIKLERGRDNKKAYEYWNTSFEITPLIEENGQDFEPL